MPIEFFLDVNVMMYAAGESSEYKESCVNVLHKVQKSDLKVAIDTEIIQELLYRYHSLGLRQEGVKLALYTLRLKPSVLPVTARDVEDSIHLYHKYINNEVPPRDTLHLAVMLNNDIDKIITVDKHFGTVIREVERIDPKTLI